MAGVTLALHVPRRPLPVAARLSPEEAAFSAARGSDMRLELVEAPPPEPGPGSLLFHSGGPWRVHRHLGRLLYAFRAPNGPGTLRAAVVDPGWRRGRLYLGPSRFSRHRGFALFHPLAETAFQHHLAHRGGMIVHACGVSWRGRAALFLGRSGAGKTTTARLWERLRPGAAILSDDRVALRFVRGRPMAFGTPWHGLGRFASPEGAPLSAVFVLRQAGRTRLSRLAAPAAAAQLFARSFPPVWDRAAVARVLASCTRLAARVPCYELRFRPDASALAAVEACFR